MGRILSRIPDALHEESADQTADMEVRRRVRGDHARGYGPTSLATAVYLHPGVAYACFRAQVSSLIPLRSNGVQSSEFRVQSLRVRMLTLCVRRQHGARAVL
eukprot:3176268-Rhodomonas_salina.6